MRSEGPVLWNMTLTSDTNFEFGRAPQMTVSFNNSLEVYTQLTESGYTYSYNWLQRKNAEYQPKEKSPRAQSGWVPNVKLQLSPEHANLPEFDVWQYTLHIAHLGSSFKLWCLEFLLASLHRCYWLPTWLISASRSTDSTWPKVFTLSSYGCSFGGLPLP